MSRLLGNGSLVKTETSDGGSKLRTYLRPCNNERCGESHGEHPSRLSKREALEESRQGCGAGALGVVAAEKKFRRIKGYREMGALRRAFETITPLTRARMSRSYVQPELRYDDFQQREGHPLGDGLAVYGESSHAALTDDTAALAKIPLCCGMHRRSRGCSEFAEQTSTTYRMPLMS